MGTLHPFCPYLLIEAAALSAPEVAEDLQGAGLFWRTCSAKPPKSSSEIKLHKAPGGKKKHSRMEQIKKNVQRYSRQQFYLCIVLKSNKPVFTKNLSLGENYAFPILIALRHPAVLTIYLFICSFIHSFINLVTA